MLDKDSIAYLANIAAVNNYISSIINSSVRTSFSREQMKELNGKIKELDKEFVSVLTKIPSTVEQTKKIYSEIERTSLAKTLNNPVPTKDAAGSIVMVPTEDKPEPAPVRLRPKAIKGPGGEIIMEPEQENEVKIITSKVIDKKPVSKKGTKRVAEAE